MVPAAGLVMLAWGKALSACPPASIVATQVVRVRPTIAGFFASTAAASASPGFAANFAMA